MDNLNNILKNKLLSGEEKIIYIILERFSDDKNISKISTKDIMKMTKWTERKVKKFINSLEDKGVISIVDEEENDSYKVFNYSVMWDSVTMEGLRQAAHDPILVMSIRLVRDFGGQVIAPDGENVTDDWL